MYSMNIAKVSCHGRVPPAVRIAFDAPALPAIACTLSRRSAAAGRWLSVAPGPRHRLALFLALLLAIPGAIRLALAHGDLHERIEQLDKSIATSPDDYDLYLKRGELHRQHQEWSLAVADFAQVQRLAPRAVDVDYYLGLTWLEAGQPRKALPCLDRYLTAHPDHPQVLLARARARVNLGEHRAAVLDYSRAIDLLAQPTPDLYIEQAGALLAQGDSQLDAAMDVIRQGVRKIGPVVSLVEFAVTTETSHGRYENALAWIGALPANLAAQPRWLARRADVLAADGKKDAALADYRAAYETVMQNLQRRNTPANLAFEAELRQKIAAIETRASAPK